MLNVMYGNGLIETTPGLSENLLVPTNQKSGIKEIIPFNSITYEIINRVYRE